MSAARYQITNRVMPSQSKIIHTYFTDTVSGATNLHRELQDGEGLLAADDWTDEMFCAELASVLGVDPPDVEMEPLPPPPPAHEALDAEEPADDEA